MKTLSHFTTSMFLAMSTMQKHTGVNCYAYASSLIRKPSNKAIKGTLSFMRGGSSHRLLAATSASQASPMKQESSLQQKANQALSIGGTNTEQCFGGLQFRDSSDQYRVLFVLGGPGAGKGTQSALLLENYPCVHLSAGELLRDETKKPDSEDGALIEQCLVDGKIVPVEISLNLLQNAMKNASGRSLIFLIDGFPRNFDNLEGWTRCMEKVADVLGVLVYQCPLSVLEQRILERAKSSGRSDDNIESIRRRFKTFEDETIPVINALRLVGDDTALNVFDIRGEQPLDDVWQKTQEVMNSIISSDVLAANMQLLEAVAMGDVQMYAKLCADDMFATHTPADVMSAQEGNGEFPDGDIENAVLTFISGTRVLLTYDRLSKKSSFKERRVWSHQEQGWKMVHFSRSPR